MYALKTINKVGKANGKRETLRTIPKMKKKRYFSENS